MASGVRPAATGRPAATKPRQSAIERSIRIWPVFALLPIIVVGQIKATGYVAIGGFDTTLLSALLVVVVTGVAFMRHPRYPVRQMSPFFVFTLVVLVGVTMSNPGEYQALKARDFLLTAVVVTCIPVLLRDLRDLRGMLAVWYLGGTLVAALVLLVGGADDLYGRAAIGEATLGPAYLSAAALAVGGAALGEKLLPAFVALPGIAISGVALVTIGSRGPMVGAAVGLVAWMLLRGVLRARSLLVLLVVSVVAAVGVGQASETALSRLVLADPAREGLWATARMTFIEHPFLGLGWGDYSTVGWDIYPHNLFLEAAAELGLLGLLCVVTLLGIACARVWRNRSEPAARVLAAVAIVMLMGQQFSSDLTNRVFWIAVIPCLLLPVQTEAASATESKSVKRSRGRRAARPMVGIVPRVVEPPHKHPSRERT